MNYNEFDLSSLIDIHDIRRSIGNNRTITTSNSPFLGSLFQKIKVDSKKIIVDFSIWTRDRNRIKHQLASIFNQSEPKKLTLSDEPGKYYLALVVDEIQMQEASIKRSYGSITFFIPDGVAHSTSYKYITDFTEQNGKVIFNITNNGNVEALPIITAKMNSENGYFGLVNQTGIMEIGDREIINSETRTFSERPFDYSDSGTKIADGFSKGAKNVAISNDTSTILDKNLSIIKWLERDHLVVDGTVVPSGNHAGSLTFDLPDAGSLFDRIWWRQIFHVGDPNQFGYVKVLVSDTDGKFLYGIETIKRKLGFEAECNFLITDGQGGYKLTDFKKTFTANGKDTDNPFNDSRGWMDIVRQDDNVSLFWFGSRIPKVFAELKGKKSAKLHVIIGGMGGKTLVTRMYLDGIKYQKDNVAFGYNIPNPYGQGSTVVINGENKTLLVDNIPKLNHVVDYSKWPKIPPGPSTLEITTSTWNKIKPTFSLAFEERWL